MTAIGARVPRHYDDANGVAHHVHADLLWGNPWAPRVRRRSQVMPTPGRWQHEMVTSAERRIIRRLYATDRREEQRQARIAAGTDRATLRARRAG